VDFKFVTQDQMAVEYLVDMIGDPDMEPYHRVLMSDLIIRESTRRI
jgi:hypothetical protein